MTHEYGDPISAEAIQTAAELAILLQTQSPDLELRGLVEEAVRRSFCSCVLAIQDEIERGVSGVHSAVVEEVLALVVRRDGRAAAPRL